MQVTRMVRAVLRVHLALVIINQRREGLQQRKVNSNFFNNVIASNNMYVMHFVLQSCANGTCVI